MSAPGKPGPLPLIERPGHRAWLWAEALRLLAFHRASAGGASGFWPLSLDGTPDRGATRFALHETTRMVHVFALARQLGLPGLAPVIDQGMTALWQGHRDAARGGYVWEIGGLDDKRAYGHAFVLLAASSALRAGHPEARRLLDDVAEVIEARFWEEGPGACREEFRADWSEMAPYRGQNANMHMTEALMAAFEATGERLFLDRARRIAERIIDQTARAMGWRVAEHFTADWKVDPAYDGDPMFRPAGLTPGHALEWARLLVQLHDLTGGDWMLPAARALFAEATRHGWDAARGGFVYTLDWQNRPLQSLRLWWPNAEAIGAAAALWRHDGDAAAAHWYAKVWEVVASQFIDHTHGGWFPELDADNRPTGAIFHGKPDIYHAFQACLVPLLPKGVHLSGDLTRLPLA